MKKLLSTVGAFLTWMFTGIAAAQTTTATSTATTTPGVPNTGAGDIALNAIILVASATIALAGASYLYARRALPFS